MFPAKRWALAYDAVCSGDVQLIECGLEFLKTVLPFLSAKKGYIAGTSTALRADRIIACALRSTQTIHKRDDEGHTGYDRAIVMMRRFIFLLIKRGHFRDSHLFVAALTDILSEKKQLLSAILEAAEEPTPEYLGELEKVLIEKFNVKGVNFIIKINKTLLAGYKIQIGSELLDSSLSGRLKDLERYIKELE
jgi:hypothetical protein